LLRSIRRAIIPAVASRTASQMSEHQLHFICPRCGHRYSSGFSTGPRAVCPECKYDPTLLELMDSQRESVWPIIFGLLVVAAVIALVFFATDLF
jgi:hypothetical protein